MSSDSPSPAGPSVTPRRPFGVVGLTKLGVVSYGVAVATLILDQASKYWILNILNLPEKQTVRLLPILSLTMVWNPGVSFGLLRAGGDLGRLLLAAFAAAVTAGLIWWARSVTRPLTAVGLGMVMGGAIGNNLVDRLRFGRVVDFIDVSGLHFFPWVFNIADSGISIGVALLILDSLSPAPSTPS